MKATIVFVALLAVALAGEEFSYECCGNPNVDPLVIKSMSVSPAPIKQGQNVTVSMDVNVAVDFTDFKVVLVMEKATSSGKWIKIPCIDDIGSCTYDNACDFLAKIPESECPTAILPFGCHCPIKAYDYVVRGATYGPVPSLGPIGSGTYRVQVTATSIATGKLVFCYIFHATLA